MKFFRVFENRFSIFSVIFRVVTPLLFFTLGAANSWANGTETTWTANCSTTPATNINQMQISQFVNYSGLGYGYVAATAPWLAMDAPGGSAAIVVAGIPAGATIIKAFLETVYLDQGGNLGLALNINGTAIAGIEIGFANEGVIWNNTAYGTTSIQTGGDDFFANRFDVTAEITGNATYTITQTNGDWPSSTCSLIIVYQLLPSTTTTSVQIADGLFAWETGDGAAPYMFTGDAPEPVSISFCGNTCASPTDNFTRIGGDQIVTDGVQAVEGYDTFDTPNTNPPTIIYTEPTAYVLGNTWDAIGGGPEWANLATYALPNSVVGAGTSSLEYWMSHALDDTTDDHKVDLWLNALVNEVSCGPTPTPTFTNTFTPTFTKTFTNTYTPTYTNTFTKTFTNTFTPTITNTFTPTITNTFTNTFTKTFTNTFTPTITNTFTPTITNTFTNTFTKTFTNTFTPTITNTFTNTFTKTFTNTFTPTVTNTFTPTITNTFTPTYTNTFTKTVTNTFTPTFTNTFTPTFTNTLMNTPTPTNTFTKTFTNTFTPTVTNTFTPTFTNTFTNTFTKTFTNTYTPTITNTFTPTFTNTFTHTPTNTFTPTFTNTLINTATPTNTPTKTFTQTFTNTPVDTPTPTNTPTNTFTPTFTNTPIDTPTPTNTPTNTFTPTFTNTLINTATPTNTFTMTPTNTNTNTPVNTPTPTNTPTNTFTPTFTNTLINSATPTDTPTNTFTPTNTNTPIDTPTTTNTPTNTNTDTFTNTPVATATPTNTWTSTFTPTITNTWTNTNTATSTNSWTPTNTITSSPTSTNTFTNTPTSSSTRTDTSTQTSSPTNTATSTFTFTPSFTPTPLTGLGLSKQVSETQAHSGDVLTYNIAVTVTGNSATGLVVSDTLPANMTFSGFSGSNLVAGTFTQSSDLLQWVMPSPLAVGVYHLTYQTQVNNFVAANTVILNKAQLTSGGSLLPINASAPVTTIGNFTVKVNVYNSAGEVVKAILIQVFSQPVNSITLSTSNMITTLNGPGSTIEILYDGYLIGTWNGTNNSGQPVSNGNYSIQVDNMGQSGVVTSVSQNATVNRSLANIKADVYNESGEIVRTLYDVVSDPVGSNMTNVTLSSNIFRPSLAAPTSVTSNTANLATIFIETSATPVTLTWDGTNNSSNLVTPGVYTIEVHWNNGSGSTADISREIIVMAGSNPTGIAVARPNILNAANGMTTTFDATGVQNAYSIKVQIYTMTGQLIQTLTSPQGSPIVPWNASGMASGIYIAAMEIDNSSGGMLSRQRLKVLLLH